MIGRRSHRPYKPPQLLTGRIDDFPLVPETPIDIVPRPILPPPSSRCDEHRDPERPSGAEGPRLPVSHLEGLRAPTAKEPGAEVPAAAAPPSRSGHDRDPERIRSAGVVEGQPPKAVRHTIEFVVQPDSRRKRARKDPESALDYSELGVEKLRKAYDWIGRVLSDRGVPPPEPEFPRTSRHHPGRAARSGATKTKTHPASTRDHHSRHCTICNHPERAAIEEEFIHWHDPSEIGLDYEVGRRAVYRHAHASGLFARRERNMRFALGHMVQRAMNITPTSDSILRAIRAYSCLNRRGQWTEPASHVIVSSGSAVQRPLNAALAELPASSLAAAIRLGSRSRASIASRGEALPSKKTRLKNQELPVTARRVERDAND